MTQHTLCRVQAIALTLSLWGSPGSPAEAQKWLKNAVKNSVKGEAARQANRVVRKAIRCTVGETECWEKAKKKGKNVVFVDEEGNVIEDAEGQPVMDPADLPPAYRDASLYERLTADGRATLHDPLFEMGAATLRPGSEEALEAVATMLVEHDDLELVIEGHTAASADFDADMELSRRRTESVKRWLVENRGIASERLRTMGLGSTRPVEGGGSAADGGDGRLELVRVG